MTSRLGKGKPRNLFCLCHHASNLLHLRRLHHQTKIHRKKRFRGFPFPSRDVTYQTLSRREYVSLIKPEVFPFPSWNSHRILLNQLVFLFAGMSFPDIPLLQAGILPRSLITRLCTCSQPEIFPYFPLLGSLPLSY